MTRKRGRKAFAFIFSTRRDVLYFIVFLLGVALGLLFAAAHYKDEIARVKRIKYVEYLREQENGIE